MDLNWTSLKKRVNLLLDYSTPDFFKEDFYNLNERTREFYPNYRHFIIGGPRTGTNLHVDPKCTGAWNTLLYGHKKWALFPPGTDEAYLQQLEVAAYAKKPATYWWQDVVPKIQAHMGMIEYTKSRGNHIRPGRVVAYGIEFRFHHCHYGKSLNTGYFTTRLVRIKI